MRTCLYCDRIIRRRGIFRAWKAQGRQGYACMTAPEFLHVPAKDQAAVRNNTGQPGRYLS